jgi:hypothetical protein
VQEHDPEAVYKRTWDYSKHHFEYTAVAPAHQVHLLTTLKTLHRPPPPPEDDDEYVSHPTPIIFRLLDENIRALHVPSTADEPRPLSLSDFPALGAYYAAAAVSKDSGRFISVVAANSLVPNGDGAHVSAEDQQFISDVACAVGERLDAFPRERITARAHSKARTATDALHEELKALRVLLPPPAPPEDAMVEGVETTEGEVGDPTEGGADGEAEGDTKADPVNAVANLTKQVRLCRITYRRCMFLCAAHCSMC